MKKFMTLIALSFVFLISAGFSTPELMTTKQDDPLHSIFYKENTISTTSYVIANDNNGDPLTLSDVFVTNNEWKGYFDLGGADSELIPWDIKTVYISVYYTQLANDTIYSRITGAVSNINLNNAPNNTLEIYSVLRTVESSDGVDINARAVDSDSVDFTGENTQGYAFIVDTALFEEEPSKDQMDAWAEIYIEIEENGTYYYYTFDGSVISIIWVAMLFSGVIYYVRESERDTSSAVVYGAIFFIIGTALLRVIQVII